jgi:hypothetical protein
MEGLDTVEQSESSESNWGQMMQVNSRATGRESLQL